MTSRDDDEFRNGGDGKLLTTTLSAVSVPSIAGVVWSEIAVFRTGCGPISLPDVLERNSYLMVLGIASISIFTRIVAALAPPEMQIQPGFAYFVLQFDQGENRVEGAMDNKRLTLILQWIEALAAVAVAGAILVLLNQALNGETMDGMSGIDLSKCRSRQSFEQFR